MALYGIYRPRNFSDVVGQESIKTTLLHASAQNKISHALLFCGTRGTGKTTSARIVAKALNCTNLLPSGDPCLECDFCIASEEGRMTDIIEIDAASNRGIDEIRDLREKVNFSPNFGKAKIYIIDEVHMLTKEAFNALLKTLEEPPAHAYFILATTEFHKVPETIRSRCQTFFFRKISLENIVERLEFICEKENIKCDRKGIEIIAERANGGLRDAISLLEQSASYGEISEKNLQESLGMISEKIFENFLETLSNGDSKKALSILDSLQDEGRNLEEFGKDFLGVLRKKFHEFLHARDGRLPWILQIIEIFEVALQNYRSFDIPPLAFEIAIAKAMLLQEEFKNSLYNKNVCTEEKVIGKLVKEKHHIQDVKNKELQNWVDTPPDFEEQKKIQEKISKKRQKFPPPWLSKEIKDNEKISQNVEKIISKYDDSDMFPSPQSEEKNNNLSVKTFSSDSLEESIKKHWNEVLSLLPGSIKTMLSVYGKIIKIQKNSVVIEVKSESIFKLLCLEKNITKINNVFSKKFNTDITVEYILNTNKKVLSTSNVSEKHIKFPVSSSKKIENSESIEISEMEEMLKF